MSHRDRFIFVQALGKPIVENYFATGQKTQDIQDGLRYWTRFLYDLAGELEPKEQNPDMTKMHPNTTNKYIRRIREAIENDDSFAMVEIRDSLKPAEWAWLHHKLYTSDSHEAKRLCDLADELELGENT